jgi:hypothetical protein
VNQPEGGSVFGVLAVGFATPTRLYAGTSVVVSSKTTESALDGRL